ncbi:hypothetical protein JCM19037_2080 [Geomicrobium sp. JCM 19037]|uniref:hypothetical protein n=1 Tax=Geomicrobium sp. JCM 19037 TaxID=1460634 RepID=UPI00045F28D9|nr:hypothetical protein [Geomicrobium sp. JCM 19037]GAK03736.1 hypothetical protein JCM19037_2080 [Geomicrobium sp. JCM 19037]
MRLHVGIAGIGSSLLLAACAPVADDEELEPDVDLENPEMYDSVADANSHIQNILEMNVSFPESDQLDVAYISSAEGRGVVEAGYSETVDGESYSDEEIEELEDTSGVQYLYGVYDTTPDIRVEVGPEIAAEGNDAFEEEIAGTTVFIEENEQEGGDPYVVHSFEVGDYDYVLHYVLTETLTEVDALDFTASFIES